MSAYVCYVDESGVPTVHDVDKPGHFVLLGMVLRVDDWKDWDEEIRARMARFGIEAHEELHAAKIYKRYEEQYDIAGFRHLTWQQRREAVDAMRSTKIDMLKAVDLARLKATKRFFKESHAYIHLTLGERRNLLVSIADAIATGPEVELICHAIDKGHYYSVEREPLIERAFTGVVRRFEEFLASRARTDKQATTGLIVQDHNQAVASRLTALMGNLHRYTDKDRRIRRIIETPLFVDSRLTRMVQVADLCAFAVRRYFDTTDHDLFDRVSHKFHYANNRLVGIRHFSTDTCQCRICKRTVISKVQARMFDAP